MIVCKPREILHKPKGTITSSSCCGLADFHGINESKNVEEVVAGIARGCGFEYRVHDYGREYCDEDIEGGYGAVYVTYAHDSRNLDVGYDEPEKFDELVAYIKKHKLGDVTVCPKFTNPNTQYDILTLVWSFDHQAMFDWVDQVMLGEKVESEDGEITAKPTVSEETTNDWDMVPLVDYAAGGY